jgi:VanZ family protein
LTPERKQLWKVWIAAGLWLVLIAIESTAWLSADNTSRFLYPIFHFLTGVDRVRFEVWNHYLRKIGHFVGYFGLSWLLYRAWRVTLPGPKAWMMRWASIAFAMTALTASLDEWHQTFIPSRTGTWEDVLLDSSAALTAQVLILLWAKRRPPAPVTTSIGSEENEPQSTVSQI